MGYRPRLFRALPPWTIGAARFKPYVIRAETRNATPDRLAEAQAHLAGALPAHIARCDDGATLGFVILHLGEDADWLLADWWVDGDSLAQCLYRGEPGLPGFTALADTPFLACVWELVVHGHERRAWIDAMMQDHPDPAAYLADRLPDRQY